MIKRLLNLVVFLSFLAACAGKSVPTATLTATVPSPTVPVAPPPVTIAAPTPIPNPTATLDRRLPPERWQEWPVVPAVTPRAIEIYRTGLAMGLNPHAFSKVGDCQSVKAAFMGYFDIPTWYTLGEQNAYLQTTIDNFAGYFNTDGQAVRGGFNAAAVLSPLWADPNACLGGENPLECELRITKPTIVFVSLEVWWNGRTPEQYEKLIRRILDTIIAHGAVPILATKADNVEGDNSLNLTTARLAYEYDLPLWNFWLAVQTLPDHGMDMQRNDGFHISTAAWNVRSFTALQALDSVWRGVRAAAPGSSATRTPDLIATPGMISTLAYTPFPSAVNTAGTASPGGTERVVFGLACRQGEGYQSLGVYLLDPLAGRSAQIFGPGVQFQSASPEGRYILVSDGSALYRTGVDGTDPLQLTDALYAYGSTEAVWLPSGQIAAVLAKSNRTVISLLSLDGRVVADLTGVDASPIGIFPNSDGGKVYWESGTCTSPGVCATNGTFVTSVNGSLTRPLAGITDPLLAPDGSLLAYTYTVSASEADLGIAAPDGSAPRRLQVPGKMLTAFAWSPKGDVLALVVTDVSDYSGRSSGNRTFILDPRTQAIVEYPPSSVLTPRLLWSPDGTRFLWMGTLPADQGFTIAGSLVERASKKVLDLTAAIGQSSQDYLLVSNAAWLSLP